MTKGKKKALIITLSIVGVLVIAIAITCIVLFTRDPETPPEGGENTVYQTQPESFWQSFGSGYMSFDIIEEPAEPVEGELYGNVFKVYAYNKGNWEAWLLGTWEMSADETTLTLTAEWDEDDSNAMKLTDAVSGEPKVYTASDGKFSIGVSYPGGPTGQVTFTLDPVADKVGEGETSKPPCTEHVDADGDGKCDNCGADMPDEPSATVAATLSAETDDGQSAKIELLSDNTWILSISYYQGGEFVPTANGTYTLDAAYNMVLTVTEDTAEVLAEDSYTLVCDYATQTYSGTIVCNVTGVGELTFAFTQETSEEPETPAEIQLTLVAPANAAGQSAQIDFYTDNSWTLSVSYYTGMTPIETAGGTWALDSAFNMVLTVTEDTANVLPEEAYTFECDYTTQTYSGTISCNLAVGEVTFAFGPSAEEPEETFTVTFDMNDGATQSVQVTTSTFTAADGTKKQYIPLSAQPQLPQRNGWLFVGWDTSKTPVMEDGASKTEWFLGEKMSGVYTIPDSPVTNDVMEITEDMTLYARWVQPTYITTETELRAISEDLGGWYILQNDITLTSEWEPVGRYYSTYEFLETNWWKYAFDGIFDGNGKTIFGLKLNTLKFDYGTTEDGSADGTTAFFGSVCDGEIKNVTIKAPVITISSYSDAVHAYVSVLAAFVHGNNSVIADCNVADMQITVTTEDVAYVAVSGLLGGHWGGHITGSSVTGTITAAVGYGTDYESATTNLYVGGLVGEGYCWVEEGCSADVAIELTVTDERTTVPQGAAINIFAGGLGGSAAYTSGNHDIGGSLRIDCDGVMANTVNAFVGGIAGIQRYGYLEDCTSDTQISVVKDNSAASVYNIGRVLGGYDMTTSMLFLDGTNNMKVKGCDAGGVAVSVDGGSTLADVIGHIPTKAEIDANKWLLELMGIDLSVYVDSDGEYTIFGAENCK